MYDQLIVSSYRKGYTVNFCDLTNDLIEDLTSNSFLIIDSNVNDLYPQFGKIFKREKIFIVESNENNKSLPFCQQIIDRLLISEIKRNHKLIAVGGGIVQDIVGFISSILYRGIDWVFLPTTLLAQADSCIGSKTSINVGNVKNVIGTFHPPERIFCCSQFRSTLNTRDLKSGIGEILHYYLIDNNPKIHELMEHYEDLFENRAKITGHIYESLAIKRRMIIKDEFDENERKIFNYGHTFGHAIETLSQHQVPHGQAVTLGMDIANFVALKFGYIDDTTYNKMRALLVKNIPNYKVKPESVESYMKILAKDKKNIDDSIVCILPHSIGDMRIETIDKQKMQPAIQEYIEKYK